MKIGKRACLGALALVAAVGMGTVTGCANTNQQTHHDCTVQAKERLVSNGSSGEKRVMTTCGVFAVEDSFAGGFNSYDTWAKLTEGQTFDIRTGGHRVGWLSMFPTVLEVTHVG